MKLLKRGKRSDACLRKFHVVTARGGTGRYLSGFWRVLRLNERAADDIFSGWSSASRYEPPANAGKTFKIFLS